MMEGSIRHIEVFSYAELVHLTVSVEAMEEVGIRSRFMEAMGPSGPGLVGVHGIPHLHSLREALLPLAPILALSSHQERSTILKAHGLGTDVSLKDRDRLVSSFASQLSFEHDSNAKVDWLNCHERKEGNELDFLGSIFRQLGKEMINLGLLVARVCDIAIQGAGLENAILQAATAKGRLIHYHSLVEKQMLQRIEAGKQRRILDSNKSPPSSHSNKDLWQQWHYDYGIFTILTMPMFFRGNHTNVDSMDEAVKLNYSSSLETSESNSLFPHIGLKILNIGNRMVEFVCAPNDCLLVQVGEAAQILTGGKLRATAHCVCQPLESDDVSRETFVVFLQPSWDMCLVSPNEYETNGKRLENAVLEEEFSMIQCRVPPLESRWRNGCTFAEFSRETTKQYYGTNGAQAKK